MNISWSSTCLQILHLATSLQVNDLRRVCEEALKRQVHIANIISTYHVARKFRLPNLEEYALNYMQVCQCNNVYIYISTCYTLHSQRNQTPGGVCLQLHTGVCVFHPSTLYKNN